MAKSPDNAPCKRHPGCDCPKCKGCTHPEDEPCWPPQAGDVLQNGRWKKASRPNPSPAEPVDAQGYRPPPSHYQGRGGIDPWAYIEAQGLNYWAGNVIKYVTRAGRKDIATRLEDLLKARDFLNYMIEREKARKTDAR